MRKITAKDKLRLSQQLTDETKALNVMRYSSLSKNAVESVFKGLNADFRKRYKIEVPTLAKDETMRGKLLTFPEVGCYWILSRR